MARFVPNAIGVALVVLMTQTAAWAQATAQVSGTVRDSSGGVLPGVTVTVTQTDTGFSRTVVTEASGTYVVPNLPTGPYKLENPDAGQWLGPIVRYMDVGTQSYRGLKLSGGRRAQTD